MHCIAIIFTYYFLRVDAATLFYFTIMKKETLEEAAEKEFPLLDTKWCRTGAAEEENLQLLGHRRSFINGAKWQSERMYSEEDMLKCWNAAYIDALAIDEEIYKPLFFEDFIKQFKKK